MKAYVTTSGQVTGVFPATVAKSKYMLLKASGTGLIANGAIRTAISDS